MHPRGKGIGASCRTKKRLLQGVPESVSDVYDFDQQDASRISSTSLQSEGLAAKFRTPLHIRHDSQASRKCVKNKMPHSANAVIEASHSGKTSTPYAVTGHQKTKKKTPGTPAPWVVLSRLQQNSLAAYAVSPIAVEHNSPNDLSRQIDVNSMFDDTSSSMDDSAVIIPKSKSDDVGTDWNNEMLVASYDKVPSSSQCVVEDSNVETVSQEYNTEKHKSETDSGYPRFDSQCEFISLLAGDSIGTAKERSKACKKRVNVPAVQNVSDSGDDGNIIRSADSDCEMVLYRPGTLEPKQFNSSDARNTRKFTTKRRQQVADVEPSDESADSDAGVSSDVRSKSSVKRMPNHSVEDAASLSRKPSHVLRTRSTAVDSNSTKARHPLRKKDRRKSERNAESVEMSDKKSLRAKKPGNVADAENAGMLEKPKSRHRPTKKQDTVSHPRKGKENVRAARVEEEANGPDRVNGDAECKC